MKKIVCYDLHSVTDSSVYSSIKEDIEKKYPKSVYILNTTYLIYTSDSTNTIFENIKYILTRRAGQNNFEFFTSKYSEEQGWLQNTKWDKIKDKLKSSTYY
ncbi:MAG: hypothetical protein JXK08_02760 [Flavobacteriaceae bacterium]|nr:hypothetical protein [Flavobacteriaceae bacterium]